jgi:hypothetical protein
MFSDFQMHVYIDAKKAFMLLVGTALCAIVWSPDWYVYHSFDTFAIRMSINNLIIAVFVVMSYFIIRPSYAPDVTQGVVINNTISHPIDDDQQEEEEHKADTEEENDVVYTGIVPYE